ncbi:hypothetical protein JTB14_032009 [Gonioctena quinquepunctata]|nr:hypothetical protein JTB14_032009 [Gonioctena quinquepunctata]
MNLESPLKEWGFMDLFDLFKVYNEIDENAFNLMDDINLKELIPNIEERLKFKKEFTKYLLSRENIQCYPVDNDESNTSNDDTLVPELERRRLEAHSCLRNLLNIIWPLCINNI